LIALVIQLDDSTNVFFDDRPVEQRIVSVPVFFDLIKLLASIKKSDLHTLISLKMAERSKAKSAKRSFASKLKIRDIFYAKLRFSFLASLRSAILRKIKMTINWSLFPARVNL